MVEKLKQVIFGLCSVEPGCLKGLYQNSQMCQIGLYLQLRRCLGPKNLEIGEAEKKIYFESNPL